MGRSRWLLATRARPGGLPSLTLPALSHRLLLGQAPLCDTIVTGIATKNDAQVRVLVEAWAALRGEDLAAVRKKLIPNLGDKSFKCGADEGELGSSLVLLCLQRDESLVFKFSDTPGGDGGLDAKAIADSITRLEEDLGAARDATHAWKQALLDILQSKAHRNYLLRWRWGAVGDSVLRGTAAPIDKILIGEDKDWSRVPSKMRGTTGGVAVKVFANEDHPLRIRFGSAHITFSLRFNADDDEEECELVLLGLLGATEDGIHMGGWPISSLKPQSGGDARAGLDIARDGRLKTRGREGGRVMQQAYNTVKAGGTSETVASQQRSRKRMAEAAAGAAAAKAATAAAPQRVAQQVELLRNEQQQQDADDDAMAAAGFS